MSLRNKCIKTYLQLIREHPEIPCNCPVDVARRNSDVKCDCLKCNNYDDSEKCDCSYCTESDEPKNDQIENNVATKEENDDVESLQSCDSGRDKQKNLIQNKKKTRQQLKRMTKAITTSWKFYLFLFILATIMGVVFYINKSTECNKNIEMTESSVTTTAKTTTTTEIIRTTTDGIWNTIKYQKN